MAEPDPAPAEEPVARLIDRGWSQVESDPEAARREFGKVLERDENHDEANYGYGYSLLMQSHPDAAKYLCKAADSRDPDIRQDVVGLIVNRSLSCP